ncbi:MAG: sulfatase-like hydrolase/transferase [Carboxylicivirga sp.]|jgi:arylsulfatase A-like enzyme|nr:sulfatase-like hydrolase/transferase [Carboxylicivirga sp.]
MKRYIPKIIFVTFVTVFASCNTNKKAKVQDFDRPNILFVTTDYTRGEDLPVTGAPFLNAPALSKLCDEGAVFTRHSSVAPICMPARASIATGCYPHSHSLWDNGPVPLKQEGLPLLTTELKKMGYQTVGIGKMHFHPFKSGDYREGYYDYDVRVTLEGKAAKYKDDDYEKYLNEHGTSRKELLSKAKQLNEVSHLQTFFDWHIEEELHADAFVGKKAIETIEQNKLSKDKPWFMWVSFTGPHNPWNAPERFSKQYREMEDLPLGDFVKGELAQKPLDYTRHRYGYGGDLMKLYDKSSDKEKLEIQRGVRAGHYGMLSLIDEYLGAITDELKAKGQLDNTIVIFSSDHGSALFDNEMLHKGSSFPTQSFVPFVVWYPGAIKPGIRTEFTSHVDLYSTFLELAGNKNPEGHEGKSLVEVFKTPGHKVNDFVVIESTMVTSIMNDKWLAGFHHITGETELYDLENDYMCHYNLAGNTENKEVIEDLKTQVVEWRKGLAKPGEKINDDIFSWFDELGDPKVTQTWFDKQIKSYKKLSEMSDDATGVTGSAAKKILKKAGVK